MKMKEFGPPGGGTRPWHPPLGSANGEGVHSPGVGGVHSPGGYVVPGGYIALGGT